MKTNIAVAIQALKNSQMSKKSLAYKSAMSLLEGGPDAVEVTGRYYGSGKYATAQCWSTITVIALRQVGVSAEKFNVAPRGGIWGERVRFTQAQKHLFQIDEALSQMYVGPRNRWRFEAEMERAKGCLIDGLPYKNKRAQWGGKWGNYYRMVAQNSSGRYVFVEGFNPEKLLK